MALPVAALFFRAISSMVSWRNLASSSLTRSSFFSLSSYGQRWALSSAQTLPDERGWSVPSSSCLPLCHPEQGWQSPPPAGHVSPQTSRTEAGRAAQLGLACIPPHERPQPSLKTRSGATMRRHI